MPFDVYPRKIHFFFVLKTKKKIIFKNEYPRRASHAHTFFSADKFQIKLSQKGSFLEIKDRHVEIDSCSLALARRPGGMREWNCLYAGEDSDIRCRRIP